MNKTKTIKPSDVLKITSPFVNKNNSIALYLFLFDFTIYFGLIYITICIDHLLIKFSLSLLIGIFIAFLFIVGHDCCHRSYTSSKKWNKILGVISFLPSLHNFKLWELGHNNTHHAFTNLKSSDYVYTPLSLEEFKNLSRFNQLKYKLYRSVLGHLFYYMIEIWFKKMIVPHRGIQNLKSTTAYWKHSSYLFMYSIVLLCGISLISIIMGKAVWVSLLFTLLIPFAIWNWIMGFAIYQHHTNTLTKWFDDYDEWEYWECQVGHSVHVQFPKPINLVLHNIMEHTAHHSNMNIPLYNLEAAQVAIEAKFSDKMNIVKWNWAFYMDSIRSCKLYDYKTHQWLKFNEAT